MEKLSRKPTLSVVIPCVNGSSCIDECLTALTGQKCTDHIEIIVINRCSGGISERIRGKFPFVRVFPAPQEYGIPALRAIGISQATGSIVAVIEDHCIVTENWTEEVMKAHQSTFPVIGGAVENACRKRLVDWAVFFCEYSTAMPPIRYGETDAVPGNNVSYKREVLSRIDPQVMSSCWEFFIHDELKQLGARFLSAPSILVYHKKEFGFMYFLSQRYHYSRSFAAMRGSRISRGRSVSHIFLSPLLPALIIWRTTIQLVKKRRYCKEFLFSLPVLCLFSISYALGEFVGYLFGPGGSLAKVE